MRHPLLLSTLAAAIVVAASVDTAAAAVSAAQLPGKGQVVSGVVAGATNPAAGTMDLNVVGRAVINWGQGTGATAINAGGVAGFNIGSAAHVTFTGSGGAAVLNIDSSGNASRILGALTAKGTDVFVANGNGVIVGANARIASDRTVGLIANRLDSNAAGRFANSGAIAYDGHGGDVVVRRGASFSGGGEVLIAGGGNVNVDLGAFAAGVRLSAGHASASAAAGDSDNTRATLTTSGVQRGSVGAFTTPGLATNNGTLSLSHGHLTGTFVNNGTLDLADGFAMTGALVNHGLVHAKGDITLGRLSNSNWLTTRGQLSVLGQVSNRGTLFSPDYKGAIDAHGQFLNQGRIDGLSNVGTTGGDFVNEGTIHLVPNQAPEGYSSVVWVVGGNLINRGRIGDANSNANGVIVTNGSIDNTSTGVLQNVDLVETASDSELAGFNPDADYSIRNEGSISGDPTIDANYDLNATRTTGSFFNTGVINLVFDGSSTRYLNITASNDISLGGTVQVGGQAMSSTNTLGGLFLVARNGTLTVGTPLYFRTPTNGGISELMAEKVHAEANVIGYGPDARLYIDTHQNADGSFALSIDPGVQVTANEMHLTALP